MSQRPEQQPVQPSRILVQPHPQPRHAPAGPALLQQPPPVPASQPLVLPVHGLVGVDQGQQVTGEAWQLLQALRVREQTRLRQLLGSEGGAQSGCGAGGAMEEEHGQVGVVLGHAQCIGGFEDAASVEIHETLPQVPVVLGELLVEVAVETMAQHHDVELAFPIALGPNLYVLVAEVVVDEPMLHDHIGVDAQPLPGHFPGIEAHLPDLVHLADVRPLHVFGDQHPL